MTDEELRTLVGSLATATASNTEAVKALTATAEIQARNIETIRESMTYNTETVASSLELAAEALKLSANTSRNIDRLERNINRTENNIDRLEQMVEIIIKDNQADRARISGLEGQS
jgi:methyl-accepting chemotaxis protein